MTTPLLPETIETDRLTLRPFRAEDVDEVLSYAADEEWSRFLLAVPRPYLRADAALFLARQALLDRAVHPTWAIVLDGAVIGGVNIRFKVEHVVAEMGWSIHHGLWGRGFATEAARAVVESAFRAHARLGRIGATADPRNVASLRVMEKIGMRREGTLRQSRVCRGVLVDEACYALLRAEWEAEQLRAPLASAMDQRAREVDLADSRDPGGIAALRIRLLQTQDLDALLALYRHLHISDTPPPAVAAVQAVWGELMGSSRYRYYGGFVAEQLVSSCTLTIIPNLTRGCRAYGVIENVVTHADHRRKGYATALLRAALSDAWGADCYKVMLLTGRKDEATLRFYESAGFDRHAKQAFVAKPPT